MTEADLLRRVCLDPADDLPRLLYADWCDETGRHDRAEFIRCQCMIFGAPQQPRNKDLSYKEWVALEKRTLELRAPGVDWWDDYGGPDVHVLEWRRGFAEHIAVSCKFWLTHGPAIVRQQPITRVVLSDKEPLTSEDGGVVVYAWLCFPGDYYATEHQPDHITSELFALMPPESFDGRNACVFRTQQAANDALSAAALLWARQEAGLEVTA